MEKKKRISGTQSAKNRGLVQMSIYLTPEIFFGLKKIASGKGLSLTKFVNEWAKSCQVRQKTGKNLK